MRVKNAKNSVLRKLPAVDKILTHAGARGFVASYGRDQVADACRRVVDDLRRRLADGDNGVEASACEPPAILARVGAALDADHAVGLCRVINATGIILHTGLGRAVLPKAALEAVVREQKGYSLLETDRATGDRGKRDVHVVRLLRRLTGAEDAAVVNNNAGATLIVLKALAAGREVIVSRGQLVEIGGSFRIPEVMEAGGAKLVEVGTTNKTYLEDYERRIGPQTAALLRVHTSNFRVVGFTHSASIGDLVALGNRREIPVIDDLGSGALVDLRPWGIEDEPVVGESVRAGAAVVTFSGDKLLGGPQAGIIVGKKIFIERIKKDPLYRALRLDKLTLTALEATLRMFLNPDRLVADHPTMRMLATGGDALRKAAERLRDGLTAIPGLRATVREDFSEIGGGSVPALRIPTWVTAVTVDGRSADAICAVLRTGSPCVIARIREGEVLMDLRTILDGEAEEIVDRFRLIARHA